MSSLVARDDGSVPVDANALNLRWTFGFNTKVPGNVHSLVTKNRSAIFYAASHTGIILDTLTNRQYPLQGHCHDITTSCVSADKKWIVTADSGSESMIIIWDAQKATPVQIIADPFPSGVSSLDLSTDSMFLVCLSNNHPDQQIAIYDWTIDAKVPIVRSSIDCPEFQHYVKFNSSDIRDIVTNGLTRVIFWSWTRGAFRAHHPLRGPRGQKKMGYITQTVFAAQKAISATTGGWVILWEYPEVAGVSGGGRDAVKMIKICPNAGINYITYLKSEVIVIGCTDGAVRFLDSKFKINAWFEDINGGPVISVSFADPSTLRSNSKEKPAPVSDVTSDGEIHAPEMIVATTKGKIIKLEPKQMEAAIGDRSRRGKVIVQGFDGDILAMDTHPMSSVVAVGTSEGTVQLWEIEDRLLLTSKTISPAALAKDAESSLITSNLSSNRSSGASASGSRPLSTAGGGLLIPMPGPSGAVQLADALLISENSFRPSSGAKQNSTSQSGITEGDIVTLPSGQQVIAVPNVAELPCATRSLKFSPSGTFLAVGFADGSLVMVTGLPPSQGVYFSASAAASSGSPSNAYAGGSADTSLGAFGIGGPLVTGEDPIDGNGMDAMLLMLASGHSNIAGSEGAGSQVHSSLRTFQTFNHSIGAITHIAFSRDERYLATADADHCIALYRFTHRDEQPGKPLEWVFLGKHRAHLAPIKSLVLEAGAVDLSRTPAIIDSAFEADKERYNSLSYASRVHPSSSSLSSENGSGGNPLERATEHVKHTGDYVLQGVPIPLPTRGQRYRSSTPRLFSLGEDRRLVEFDVARASIKNGLRILVSSIVDQSGTPTTMFVAPGVIAPTRYFLPNSKSNRSRDKTISNLSEANDGDVADVKETTLNPLGGRWIADTLGGTLPPVDSLEKHDPNDLIAQSDSIIVCTDEYKMKVFHMQPPAAAAAAIYSRNRDLFPSGSGHGSQSQSSFQSARSFGALADASSLSQLGFATVGTGAFGTLGITSSSSNIGYGGVASSGSNLHFRRGQTTTPDQLTGALLATSGASSGSSNQRGSHKVFWWENSLNASPNAHVPIGSSINGMWGSNIGIVAPSQPGGLQTTGEDAEGQSNDKSNSNKLIPASTALAALVTTEGGAPVARIAQKVAAPSARLASICRKVVLAPTYGGPLTNLFRLPLSASLSKRLCGGAAVSPYLVYACSEKVVGLMRLPLTGSPTHSVALIAHPGQISGVSSTPDGRFVLTAGGPDRCLNLWATNPAALDATITLGGKGASPFLSLLDGGENGPLHTSIQEFFYYAQLRAQGLHVTQPRAITGYIPVFEVPNIMRALGHFPSEQQVAEMSHEVFWDSNWTRLGDASKNEHALVNSAIGQEPSINLSTFISLFVNHRPVDNFDRKQVEGAFSYILQHYSQKDQESKTNEDSSFDSDISNRIDVSDFVNLMSNYGEKMSESELKVLLATLVGTDSIGSSTDPSGMANDYAPQRFNLNLGGGSAGPSSTASQIASLKYRRRPRLHADATKVDIQKFLPSKFGAAEFTESVLGLADAATIKLSQLGASGYEGDIWTG